MRHAQQSEWTHTRARACSFCNFNLLLCRFSIILSVFFLAFWTEAYGKGSVASFWIVMEIKFALSCTSRTSINADGWWRRKWNAILTSTQRTTPFFCVLFQLVIIFLVLLFSFHRGFLLASFYFRSRRYVNNLIAELIALHKFMTFCFRGQSQIDV